MGILEPIRFGTLAALTLGLLVASGGCREPTVYPVTRDEVLGYPSMERAPLLIDVRTAEEFDAGHVAGAINIPHVEIADRIDEILPHSGEGIVLYCRSGRRTGIAAQTLLAAGVSVGHLEGDMLGWQEAGLPVVAETGVASGERAAP